MQPLCPLCLRKRIHISFGWYKPPPLAPALHLAYYDTCFILKIRADILTFDFFFLNTILNAINAADYPSVINQ